MSAQDHHLLSPDLCLLIQNPETEKRKISKAPPGPDRIVITVIVTGAHLFATYNVPRYVSSIHRHMYFLQLYKVTTLLHVKGEGLRRREAKHLAQDHTAGSDWCGT